MFDNFSYYCIPNTLQNFEKSSKMPKIGRKEILGSTYLNPILQLIPGILDFLISSTQPVTLISNAE